MKIKCLIKNILTENWQHIESHLFTSRTSHNPCKVLWKIVYAFYKQWGFIPRKSHELQHGKHFYSRPVLKKVTNLYNASKIYSQHSWGYKTTYPLLIVLEAETQVDSGNSSETSTLYSDLRTKIEHFKDKSTLLKLLRNLRQL